MKPQHSFLLRICIALALCCFVSKSQGFTTHIIRFGDVNGYSYFPKTLNVFVGDTIKWVGKFSDLPLQSTTVPPGALPFGPINAGDTFIYVVKVDGEYGYQNNIYAPIGMSGSFIATKPLYGISNEGREFYLGFIRPSYWNALNSYVSQSFHINALISTYYDNTIRVSYFENDGREVENNTYFATAGRSISVPLITSSMKMDSVSDIPAYRACYIKSEKPISVIYTSVGVCSGGSYLALPVLGLGRNYVVASYNDNPGEGALLGLAKAIDSSSGYFMIIGTENGTTIKITPTSNLASGHPGSHSGIPVPYTIQLNRAQCYFARSLGKNMDDDISGTIIEASKPVAVLSGQENAILGGTDNYSMEARDFMIEQMIPVEFWDSVGYISGPLAEGVPPGIDGHGDAYRIYTFEKNSFPVHLDAQGITGGYDWSTRRLLSAPEKLDLNVPVEAYSTNGSKISLMQYDEHSVPKTAPWPAPSMISIVPVSRWRTQFMFAVQKAPDQQQYPYFRNYSYINVIATNNNAIKISNNGGSPLSLSSFSAIGSFNGLTSHYPNVKLTQYRIPQGSLNQYTLFSTTPFMVYAYTVQDYAAFNDELGRIDPTNGANFMNEYASPAGMQLNTGVTPSFVVNSTQKCTGWHICVADTSKEDPGIKAAILIDDPDGVYWSTPTKFSNVSFTAESPDYADGELHPHWHSKEGYCFDINYVDPLSGAFAPMAIVDNLGNAIILNLERSAPTVKLSTLPATQKRADSIVFPVKKIGEQICTTFVVKNTAPKNGSALNFSSALLTNSDPSYKIISITPPLPHSLAASDSITLQVCYTPPDSSRHRDSLIINSDCFALTISLDAHGSTGLISAGDIDFGSVKIGETVTKIVQIKNIGSANFNLTREYLFSDSVNFSLDPISAGKLPALLIVGGSVIMNIQFHPQSTGTITGGIDWSSDLEPAFKHSVKDHSSLAGIGTPKDTSGNVGVSGNSSEEFSFSIHPNPVNGNVIAVNIQGNGGLIRHGGHPTTSDMLAIFDVLGREVYRREIPEGVFQLQVPLTVLPAGVYYISIHSVLQRFVKTK